MNVAQGYFEKSMTALEEGGADEWHLRMIREYLAALQQQNESLAARLQAAEARGAELERDAELERALQRAAKALPEGYIVSVQVENGAGWVELEDYGRPIQFENADLTLAQEVAAAIDAARVDAALHGQKEGGE